MTTEVGTSSPAAAERGAQNDRQRVVARARIAAAVLITCAALAPVVVVVLQRWGAHLLPTQDLAVIDLRVRDVFSFGGNFPLTGPYSRFGWNHPGPISYYLLAAFSAPFGQPPWATLVGAALLQGVAIAWTARLAWKSGGLRWLIAWTAVVVLAYGATGPWIFLQAWNPHIVFPFFALFLLQCWRVAIGHRAQLVGLAFVATFLVQTHLGYALLVAVLGIWAVVRLLVSIPWATFKERSTWLWPAVVLAVLWFPPLIVDPVLHPPGNLAHVVRWYTRSSNTVRAIGLDRGAGILAREFQWHPPWLGAADRLDPFTSLPAPASIGWLAVPIGLIGGAWASARARSRRDLRVLAEMLGVLVGVAVVSLAEVRGDPNAYLYYWRATVGTAVVVLSLFVLVEALDMTTRRVAARTFCAFLALVLGLSAIHMTRSAAASTGPIQPMAPIARSILAQLSRDRQPDAPVIVRFSGTPLGGLHAAVINELARKGEPVYVDKDLGYQFGYGRAIDPSQVKSVWLIVEESELYSLYTERPNATVLASTTPLPRTKMAQLVHLQRHIADALIADGRSDLIPTLDHPLVGYQLRDLPGISQSDLNALALLNTVVQGHVCVCAVIAFPTSAVPSSTVPFVVPGTS
jgi:hypothetical protein